MVMCLFRICKYLFFRLAISMSFAFHDTTLLHLYTNCADSYSDSYDDYLWKLLSFSTEANALDWPGYFEEQANHFIDSWCWKFVHFIFLVIQIIVEKVNV